MSHRTNGESILANNKIPRKKIKNKKNHQEPAVAFSYIIHFEKGGFHKSGISMLNCATPACEHVARTCCRDGDEREREKKKKLKMRRRFFFFFLVFPEFFGLMRGVCFLILSFPKRATCAFSGG